MRDGFYIHIDKQDKLVQEIVKNQAVQKTHVDDIASMLIGYGNPRYSKSQLMLIIQILKLAKMDVSLLRKRWRNL